MDPRADYRAGFGPGAGSAASQSSFRRLLYDQASGAGHGLGDQPFDYRSSRRTAVGESKCAPRRPLSVYAADSWFEHVMRETDAMVFVDNVAGAGARVTLVPQSSFCWLITKRIV